MDVFGLLYVNPDPERHLNLRNRREDPLDVYLKCAINSGRSFVHFGNSYTLITNNFEALRIRAEVLELGMPPLTQLEFSLEIPKGLTFASSHRRFEVYKAFGEGRFGPRPILADLDTELIRPLPPGLDEPGAIHALDLTSVVFAKADRNTTKVLASITGAEPSIAIWAGGELMAADAGQYSKIAHIINCYWERYLSLARQGATHLSDETLTSVAVSELASCGELVVDAGAEGAVARYWSARTDVPLPSFRCAARAALVHLPADKRFLAARAGRNPDPARFIRDYCLSASGKIASRKALNLVERVVGRRPRKYAPRW